MRIVFFGSDDFAALHLLKLLDSTHEIVACVTQPDRPKGRGMNIVESPIKTMAVSRNIHLLQPESLKTDAIRSELKAFDADLFIVVAYGKILPEDILSIPRIFCVNVHGSLLPKYRGAAPINWSIINGDDETGVTVMKMSAILDAGEIILQAKLSIGPEDTAVSLRLRMAQLGAVTLMEALNQIRKGSHTLTRQDLAKVSYAPKLTKELGHVDWKDPAVKIWNLVRGLQPWPGVATSFQGKTFKILDAEPVDREASSIACGTVLEINKEGVLVSTGKKSLLITQVQPQSGKPMEARSFASGHKLVVSSLLD